MKAIITERNTSKKGPVMDAIAKVERRLILKNEHGFDFTLGKCVYPDVKPREGFFGKHTSVTIEIVGKGKVIVGEVIDGFDQHGNEVFLACYETEKIIYHSKTSAIGYIELSGRLDN